MPAFKLDIIPNLPGVTAVGLALPDDLPEEAWWKVGLQLNRAASWTNWAMGDWYNFGSHRYGDRKALIESEEWTGPGYQACMDIAMVCRAFSETSRRREDLSFSHHREVTLLPRDAADRLLDWCEETIAQTGHDEPARSQS